MLINNSINPGMRCCHHFAQQNVFLNVPLMHRDAFIDLCGENHFVQAERRRATKCRVSHVLIFEFITVLHL